MVFNAASSVLKEELKQEIVKKRHKNITFYCKKEHIEQPYSYHNLTDSLILFCLLNHIKLCLTGSLLHWLILDLLPNLLFHEKQYF